eukprot:CAMPEP_0183528584 /NCGR_PEP_ID=MMETSP0371-20130417/22816_1 /TAXON_ID=268820 /ORGANISM="Peridinium aciculiferum, Strain PAER-2" /LENGTH=115 /DNA_ID=CAMNT_0025728233 /DNA_START=690 /DNA_END=1039 /DNA_ORIENTATION=-
MCELRSMSPPEDACLHPLEPRNLLHVTSLEAFKENRTPTSNDHAMSEHREDLAVILAFNVAAGVAQREEVRPYAATLKATSAYGGATPSWSWSNIDAKSKCRVTRCNEAAGRTTG